MNKLKIKLLSAISGIFLSNESIFATSQELISAIQTNFTVKITHVSHGVHKITVRENTEEFRKHEESITEEFRKHKESIQDLFANLTAENIIHLHPLAEVIYFYSEIDKKYGARDDGAKILAVLSQQSVPYETKVHFFKTFPLKPRVKFLDIIFNTSDFLQLSIDRRLDLISFLPKQNQNTPFIRTLMDNMIFEMAYLDLVPDTSDPHETQPLQKVNRVLKYLTENENQERKHLPPDQALEFLTQIEEMISEPFSIFGEEIKSAAMANIARFKEHFQDPFASFGEWGNLWSKQAFHHEVQIKDHDGRPLILGRVLQLVFDRLRQIKDNTHYKNAFINALSSDEALRECGNGGFFGLLEFLSKTIPSNPLEERFEESHRNSFTSVELPRLKSNLITIIETGEFTPQDNPTMNLLFSYICTQKESFSEETSSLEEYTEKFNILAFDIAARTYMSVYFSNFIANKSLSYAEILAYLGSLDMIPSTR